MASVNTITQLPNRNLVMMYFREGTLFRAPTRNWRLENPLETVCLNSPYYYNHCGEQVAKRDGGFIQCVVCERIMIRLLPVEKDAGESKRR